MSFLIEQIVVTLQKLPESKIQEILDFARFLSWQTLKDEELSTEEPLLAVAGMLSGEPIEKQLIEEIKQAPDSLVAELLNLLLTLKSRQTQAEADEDDGQVERQTVLQRMGGVPQYLLSVGDLSDRDRRRAILSSKIQQRYRAGL